VDLDLGVLGVLLVLPLLFLHRFRCFGGIESRGFEHFVCSCHCIWCIGLSSLRGFVVVVSEVEKIVSLECIGTLELVTLGTWSP